MPNEPNRPHLVPVYARKGGISDGPALGLDVGALALGRDGGAGVLAFEGDSLVSRQHANIVVTPEPWRVKIEDCGSKNGTFVNGRNVGQQFLVDGDLIRLGESFFVYRMLAKAESGASDIPGRAPQMRRMRTSIDALGPHHRRALLYGRSGSVWTAPAEAIHRRINPEGQLTRLRAGSLRCDALEKALQNTNTVLLENVEELDAAAIAVLRDVRGMAPVIATSTKDLVKLSNDGGFDPSILVSFQGAEVRIPTVRERREDVLGLFVGCLGIGTPPLSVDLIETLLLYSWDGDMEEMKHVASELRVRGSGLDALVTEMVSPWLRGGTAQALPVDDSMTQVEIRRPVPAKPDLEGLLALHDDDIDVVAEALGRSRMQVVSWLQQYGLEPSE
ncbi:MAG: FHA domain-containing protein [Myxococcota bacterium]